MPKKISSKIYLQKSFSMIYYLPNVFLTHLFGTFVYNDMKQFEQSIDYQVIFSLDFSMRMCYKFLL